MLWDPKTSEMKEAYVMQYYEVFLFLAAKAAIKMYVNNIEL